ncbi:hypothetical protein LKR43_14990 [Pusillimonas sp. MFBS29]|uniref:hypothetical protein n=1 Tax=Pusillimonas sp. MFBS29 TaxID=2886690 RepID=UPI001D112854|nr:hypothetical protein [Pusillimonas sp. MFBS29]MCC2597639.1 hypothetical protein [Pusillimonas sp. MFBS29]
MRRFIVIFFIFLLPVQVLAESSAALFAGHPQDAAIVVSDAASASDTAIAKAPLSFPGDSNPQQPMHSDIADLISGAMPSVYENTPAGHWQSYRPVPFRLIYFRFIKPPRV